MIKKNPLNFGMTGGMIPMSQRVLNAQNAPGGFASNMNNSFMFGGGWAQQQVMQSIMQAQAAAQNQQPMQSGGGIGSSVSDPNNSSGNNTYAINPNANTSFAQEATGAPGSDTGNFSDGSVGYAVNRFGGFAGPTGGTIPANVATENNFNPTTEEAAMQMFGNGTTKFQPRKKLINL